MNKGKIYIAGPVTGDPDYIEKFNKAEEKLKGEGWTVINPVKVNANLPDDTTWDQYLHMGYAMLDMCNSIFMLPGFENSKGAVRELEYAQEQGMTIYLDRLIYDWNPCIKDEIPDEEVLACDIYGNQMFGYLSYDQAEGFICENYHELMYKVTAWTYKPKSYKG